MIKLSLFRRGVQVTQKLVFIDIDGTLVTSREEIPQSAQEAIAQAGKNGHRLYLCTGRSKPEIYQHILDLGFKGVIGAGGGYIESKGEVIYQRHVRLEDVAFLVDYFTKNKFNFYLESNGGLYGNKKLRDAFVRLLVGEDADPNEEIDHPFIEKITFSDENLLRPDVNKVCFVEQPEIPFEEIRQALSGRFDVIHCTVPAFGKDSGELMVPGVNKGVAIEFLIDHLGMSRSDTIGIGDGMNDLEMLELCDQGVAMGNAHPGLKAVADFVTTDLEDDGLANAFKHYNLV